MWPKRRAGAVGTTTVGDTASGTATELLSLCDAASMPKPRRANAIRKKCLVMTKYFWKRHDGAADNA